MILEVRYFWSEYRAAQLNNHYDNVASENLNERLNCTINASSQLFLLINSSLSETNFIKGKYNSKFPQDISFEILIIQTNIIIQTEKFSATCFEHKLTDLSDYETIALKSFALEFLLLTLKVISISPNLKKPNICYQRKLTL